MLIEVYKAQKPTTEPRFKNKKHVPKNADVQSIFMTFAWYGHLKNLNSKAWYVAALISWGIALFEYLLQVPANRIGYTQYSLAQLKILQEVLTLLIFVPFSMIYMNQSFKLDYVWAGLCLVGAVYFIFRS
jgi:uncharacterized protein (DUF486 family)